MKHVTRALLFHGAAITAASPWSLVPKRQVPCWAGARGLASVFSRRCLLPNPIPAPAEEQSSSSSTDTHPGDAGRTPGARPGACASGAPPVKPLPTPQAWRAPWGWPPPASRSPHDTHSGPAGALGLASNSLPIPP